VVQLVKVGDVLVLDVGKCCLERRMKGSLRMRMSWMRRTSRMRRPSHRAQLRRLRERLDALLAQVEVQE
jgi:hypothetical protein